MKTAKRTILSRRALGSLLAAAPLAAQGIQTGQESALDEARRIRAAGSARLKSVVLARATEPSFRFEP